MNHITTPPFLSPSDVVAIVSPSGAIDAKYVMGAKSRLSEWGYQVQIGPHALEHYGRFAGSISQRIADLQQVVDDPKVKAILCSRGGYGLTQIIDKVDFSSFKSHPKWLIGFSDITVLHSAINRQNVMSIHGAMAKHLGELDSSDLSLSIIKDILIGNFPEYRLDSSEYNKSGKASGRFIGGNLSVLMGLRGSQFDLQFENSILFFEEINEQLYHIDRMLQNLRFSGALSKVKGLVVGQFTDCPEDPKMMQNLYEIILNAIEGLDIPVCFDFPAGHVDFNLPLILGAEVELEVSTTEVSLSYL
jgi:muramoyltetrapeptide carboxypeptidase